MGQLYLYSVFVLFILKSASSQTADNDDEVCMAVSPKTLECFQSYEGKPIDQRLARIDCLQDFLWNVVPDSSLTEKDRLLLANLSRILNVGRIQEPFAMAGIMPHFKQQKIPPLNWESPPSGKRTRKEYRTLTPQERKKFHSAMDKAYEDGFIKLFAKIHDAAKGEHHRGASFLPWHRVFVALFEEILRTYDQTVAIPYWASKFDDFMDNPVNSILWTPEYFGNGDGEVTSGLGAYWLSGQGTIERDYGRSGTLIKEKDICKVLTRCTLGEISIPTAKKIYALEYYHDGPHDWVGGEMAYLETAAYDPVFYMHHAYIDYIWELFRTRQETDCDIDPSEDYPDVPLGDSHHPDAPMTGFKWFTNKEGIRSYWTDNWFSYAQEPSCPDCCPGCPEPAPLYCDPFRRVCVSRSKLIDSEGRINEDYANDLVVYASPMAKASLQRPRNRGWPFDTTPSDGRTRFTAFKDTLEAASQEVRLQLELLFQRRIQDEI